jgi:hypothetical protein
LLSGAGLAVAGFYGHTHNALAEVSVSAIAPYCSKPALWTMPSQFLTGTAAASGILMVDSIGNIGGFIGPFVVGWIKDSAGGYEMGLCFLVACAPKRVDDMRSDPFNGGVVRIIKIQSDGAGGEPVREDLDRPIRQRPCRTGLRSCELRNDRDRDSTNRQMQELSTRKSHSANNQ